MNTEISKDQITFYQENGYVVIEDFLNAEELENWRNAVKEAVIERGGKKMPGHDHKLGEDDGINKDAEYFNNVFDQLLNLWQTNNKVKKLMLDEGIGKMAKPRC